jgi:hypothetical protein
MMVKPHPRASGGMVDAPHSKCGDFGRGSSSLPSPIARNKPKHWADYFSATWFLVDLE